MSLRWKYIVVELAAFATVLAVFLLWHKLSTAHPFKADAEIIVWMAVLVVVLSLALLVAHDAFVAKPLRHIGEGAERLAESDHRHRIELSGSDELASIAASINRMADRVAHAQADLERQVAERTEDLRAVLEEVHERSRIAEEVNLRLAEADRRKTEFLTNISHELRTPLNSILGFVRLLQDGIFENEEERQEFLDNASQSAAHLLHLVNDVLSVGQIEAGTLAVDRKPLHPGDAIHDVLRMMSVRYDPRVLSIQFQVEGDLMVLADEVKLRQVLINLVSNAVNFTDSGEIMIRVNSDGEFVRFEVEDTGEGIPAADLERIFEKFHQVDSRGARHAGGTGLGLSICRDLVEIMGGTIGAKSDGPGKGSLFHFTLPAVASEVALRS